MISQNFVKGRIFIVPGPHLSMVHITLHGRAALVTVPQSDIQENGILRTRANEVYHNVSITDALEIADTIKMIGGDIL